MATNYVGFYNSMEEILADRLVMFLVRKKGYSVTGAEACSHNLRRMHPGLTDDEIIVEVGDKSPMQMTISVLDANPEAVEFICRKLMEEKP